MHVLYYGISSDSLHKEHFLEFKNDSILVISTFPRHMSEQFIKTLNYRKTIKKIEIINKTVSSSDSFALAKNGFIQFTNEATFIIDNRAIIDNSSNIVYVLYKDFDKKYYLTYIIDGKLYKQESSFSDAYGIMKNTPKENVMLKEKLESIKTHLGNYTLSVYKGLGAYKNFGYKSVFGVYELQQRRD
jgi:hypothetical protein